MNRDLWMGVDVGTQGVKGVVIDATQIVGSAKVDFGRDLPEFGAPDGFLADADPLHRHADPAMWVAGMKLMLARLRDSGVAMARIRGISGSAQQHGTVYLDKDLQLTRSTSPIWMDRSTARECADLRERFGPAVAEITGSMPTERFSGPQIAKFYREAPETYARTCHIHLVSSFLASVLCNRSAPVDAADASGMNLLDLQAMRWNREICDFVAPDLIARLPSLAVAATPAGRLASEFADYGLTPGIPVAVWSGDNPSSLVGMGAQQSGSAVISLGTSDTVFAAMKKFCPPPSGGHVFANPAGGFMALICFTNGSLARERVRAEWGVSHTEFDTGVARSAPGGDGRLMLPFYEPESTPPVLTPEVVCNFTAARPEEKARALLESQALAMKFHSAWTATAFDRIKVTGGWSASKPFLKIIADVFECPVEKLSSSDAAALGAAIRARAAVTGERLEDLTAIFCVPAERIEPRTANRTVYRALFTRYEQFLTAYLDKPYSRS